MNPLFVDSGSFWVDYGPVVFPESGFPRKNFGVDLCDYLVIPRKELGLVFR